MIIGRDTSHLGPSAVRASNITCSAAMISWLPANTNHQHVICVNNVEVRTVKPGVYRQTITGKRKFHSRSECFLLSCIYLEIFNITSLQ